jgi:hypothetical protein
MPKKVKPEDKLVIVGGFVAPQIKDVIVRQAEEETRSVSFILNRLLSSHPKIKQALKERQTV